MTIAARRPFALRWLAGLLLAAALHALALPVAAAAAVGDPAGHCGDCHAVPDNPCAMAPAADATADGPSSVARDRLRPPPLATLPVLWIPRAGADTLRLPLPPLLASGAARSGRATGDPPRHLRLGRLRN